MPTYEDLLEVTKLAHRDAPCPDEYCDEGWIDDGRCAGHLCGWPGHHDVGAWPLEHRLRIMGDELGARVRELVATTFEGG